VLFLKGSDGCGFGKLKEDPDNNCTQGNSNCPKTVTETHQCAMNFKCHIPKEKSDTFSTAMSFCDDQTKEECET